MPESAFLLVDSAYDVLRSFLESMTTLEFACVLSSELDLSLVELFSGVANPFTFLSASISFGSVVSEVGFGGYISTT